MQISPNLHFQVSYKLTSDDLWPWFVTFGRMNIWRFPYYINTPIWFKSDFYFSNETIFTFLAYLTTWPQDALWPWYMTSDWMNIWRFPYYINKPSLVLIGPQLIKFVLNAVFFQRTLVSLNLLCQKWQFRIVLLRKRSRNRLLLTIYH